MPIRVLVCFLAVAILIVYSWRRSWFIGACGSVILMAFLHHPEMPRMMFGIPGINAWNILMVNVTLAWWNQRRVEGLVWDMPRFVSKLVVLFIGVIVFGFVRLLVNPTPYCPYTTAGIINEGLIESLKIMLPFMLFYDGCRTEVRIYSALACVLILYFLLAVLVIRHMGLSFDFSGDDLNFRGAKLIHATTGYHRVDMAMMLAGASWGVFAMMPVARNWWLKIIMLGAFPVLAFAEALTGGRTGYGTWCVIGVALAAVKWRRLLLFLPVVIAGILYFMPGVGERLSMGFGGKRGSVVTETNVDIVTSSRTVVWPYVFQGIGKSPWIGYGRMAFVRTGISSNVSDMLDEEIGHPHNAYLEMLLDNGVLGLALVMPIYCALLVMSVSLFRDRSDPMNSAAGGLSAALLLALLIACVGAQTLYPRQGVVGMWAAAGIMLRLFVERRRSAMELIYEEEASTLLLAREEAFQFRNEPQEI